MTCLQNKLSSFTGMEVMINMCVTFLELLLGAKIHSQPINSTH